MTDFIIRRVFVALLLFVLLLTGAASAQSPVQWNYSVVGGTPTATYPGNVSITTLGTQTCVGATAGVLGAGTCGATPPSSIKVVYVCATGGNDSNNGLTWDQCKATIQAGVTAAGNGGTTMLGAGTYTLVSASGVQMLPNSRLSCVAGATITQGTAANIQVFIDLFTNSASNVTIDHCIFDGNRANNTDNTSDVLVDGTAGKLTFIYNTIQHANGAGISVSGTYNKILYNTVTDTYVEAIGIGGSVGEQDFDQVVGNVITGPAGNHAITVYQGGYNVIANNNINVGAAINSVVNTSGTAVTWVSGTQFTNAKHGHTMVINGTEYTVAAVNSATSITLGSSAGTQTGVHSAIGTGDVISLQSTSYDSIAENITFGGATGAIILSNELSSTQSINSVQIVNNKTVDCGTNCIGLQANTNGSTGVNFVTVANNQMVGPGTDGLATSVDGFAALSLYSQTAGLLSRVVATGNLSVDGNGNAGSYWLTNGSGASPTLLSLDDNIASGFANASNGRNLPTYTSLPTAGAGQHAYIIDGLAASCADTTCTTFGTTVSGGGGALKLDLWNNGSNWTLVGK